MALIKNDNKQKKHKGENIIGKIIYGFLLFAPLLAILTTCMYATFNKNAYQSYGDKYIENLTQVNNQNLLINNSNYKVVYNQNNTNPGNQVYQVNKTSLDQYITLQENEYITTIYFLNDNGTPRLNYTLNTGTTNRIMNWQDTCPTFTFNLKEQTGTAYFNTVFTSLYLMNEIERSISDVFYYAIEKTEQANIFNWSKTTGTYTVLNNTCNLLGITNTFVPMLLAYWLIISVIYFIYDIALILVWMVHKKIHELTDAI